MVSAYNIKLTRKAASDLEKIIIYYEKQQAGLGFKFAQYVNICVIKLKDFPNAFRAGLKINTREMVLTDFPFIIVYRVIGKNINIITVYHQRRHLPL